MRISQRNLVEFLKFILEQNVKTLYVEKKAEDRMKYAFEGYEKMTARDLIHLSDGQIVQSVNLRPIFQYLDVNLLRRRTNGKNLYLVENARSCWKLLEMDCNYCHKFSHSISDCPILLNRRKQYPKKNDLKN